MLGLKRGQAFSAQHGENISAPHGAGTAGSLLGLHKGPRASPAVLPYSCPSVRAHGKRNFQVFSFFVCKVFCRKRNP